MALNDVWKTLHQDFGVYYKGRFDLVPATPGVYAWFYPLRVTSRDYKEFISQVNTVHDFDAYCDDLTEKEGVAPLAWREIQWCFAIRAKPPQLRRSLEELWSTIVKDEDAFNRIRRILLRASLLMPPLYVGKTNNLHIRCGQHQGGVGSSFRSRYRTFARENRLPWAEVSDLLFTCIRTEELSQEFRDSEALVEALLKQICKPPYGRL